jgi:hypothetical protein
MIWIRDVLEIEGEPQSGDMVIGEGSMEDLRREDVMEDEQED